MASNEGGKFEFVERMREADARQYANAKLEQLRDAIYKVQCELRDNTVGDAKATRRAGRELHERMGEIRTVMSIVADKRKAAAEPSGPLTTAEYEGRIKAAMALFPEEFGLRAFPGDVFKISFTASYIPEYSRENPVMLYTVRKTATGWASFAKGTVAELQASVVKLGGAR